MATISDVARAAGVSPATVSRVLNHPDIVVAEKRNRVLAAVARLNYQPSSAARGLRSGTFDTLALLVGDISQPFHGRLAKAIEQAAEAKGYSVLLCDLDHRTDRLLGFLASLPKRGVDGILLATADDLDTPPVRDALAHLLEQGVAAVSTSQRLPGLSVPAMVMDYAAAAREATAHLLDRGRWPVACLSGNASSAYSRQILAGYRAACRAAGRRVPRRMVLDGDFQAGPARRAMADVLASGTKPEAVLAANVPMALGALRAAADSGLSVPGDLAVISCEDVPMAEYLRPSLSAVGTDLDTYGRQAVELLVAAIEGETVAPVAPMPYTLRVRDSSP
ncbi:hypothetical protein ADL22_00340 [Streptomyces sp. NRRL F-4489]|uniref:LacI family DNA-binding transcriptional regulator n=1 Tax=Streptomyces sp. NRRL F-4489 TaxID=1609095 RepID=UPI000748E6AB|nr:LacI family DNA-binding transcriptional regulator [Streptomyces sp. NRRL F-4489]KUL55382.1 hypothetical protein ADL22_00340 [Streptomyces sp. NRRL F-4489]